jgi:hypothetical protein
VGGGYIYWIWRVGLGVGMITLHCKMSFTKALELNRLLGSLFEKHEN